MVYGLIISLFLYKDLKWGDLPGLLLKAFQTSAAVSAIAGTASAGTFDASTAETPVDAIQLAAENGPSACVVAGPIPDIEALATRLEAQGAASRRLQTSHAFHSAMMDPAVPVLDSTTSPSRYAARLASLTVPEPVP